MNSSFLLMGRILRIVLLAILLAGAWPGYAQVPQLLHYQGRVAVDGVNLDGRGQFKFALVTTNLGRAVTLWSNNGSSAAGAEPSVPVVLNVSQGLYSVLLGDTSLANMTALPASVFRESNVWLRVWFNDGRNGSQQIVPDQRIAAVGYAMMAASVSDGAVTAAKLAPGAALANLATGSVPIDKLQASETSGQVLTTDPNGAVRWEKPSALAPENVRQQYLLPDTNKNSVDLEITGVMTNRVVIISGPAMELEEMRMWEPSNGVFGFLPRKVDMLPFIFEFAGPDEAKLLAEHNKPRIPPRPLPQLTLLIRDAGNVIRVRWLLNQMALTRIEPGSNARMRYTWECDSSPTSDLQYTRNPEVFPDNNPDQPEIPVIEISGVTVGSSTAEVDPINQTIAFTFEYGQGGPIYQWFKATLQEAGDGFISNRALSVIFHEGFVNGSYGPTEYRRVNYFDCYPIRYQQISGFSRRDKLRERIVIRYRLRDRA